LRRYAAHAELAHELQVIGNHYSMFNRHDEAGMSVTI
jgi:hypothetical protein